MDQQPNVDEQPTPSRRSVVCAGAVGLASMAALTACGGGSTPGTTMDGAGSTSGAGAAGQATAAAGGGQTAKAGQDSAAQQGANATGVRLDAVPLGGFTASTGADGKPVIVAQPKKGHVVAFSAVCTHQGCQVVPSGEKLDCPCHGSQFNPMNGHVLKGPATRALPKLKVKIHGAQIVVS